MKFRLLLPVALAVLLMVASAQNVFASTEIAYDDGTSSGGISGAYLAVRFTPSGQVRVVGARIYIETTSTSSMAIYVTGADHTTVLFSMSYTLPGVTGFQTINFASPPTVSGDFYIALYPGLLFGHDAVSNYGRSYVGASLAGLAVFGYAGDFMIRALVDTAFRVGGVVLPTNTFLTLAPYLAVIGLVATATIAIKKRRN